MTEKELYAIYLKQEFYEVMDYEGFKIYYKNREKIMEDKLVYHPDHYTAGGIEVIDFVEAKLNVMTHLTPFQAYCLGNALKYIPRAGVKDASKFTQDVEKAIFYLNKAIGKDPR